MKMESTAYQNVGYQAAGLASAMVGTEVKQLESVISGLENVDAILEESRSALSDLCDRLGVPALPLGTIAVGNNAADQVEPYAALDRINNRISSLREVAERISSIRKRLEKLA